MPYFRKYPGLLKMIIILILLFLVFLLFIRNVIFPVFFNLAEIEAMKMGNRIINQIIEKETENIEYKDLINYELNKNGEIILMQANTRQINQLTTKISSGIQETFEERLNINVPFLKILGFDMLAGMGPDLKARIVPAGYVNPPEIVDHFEAAGINQTRHKIYMKTRLNLKMIAPFNRKEITISADVPIVEVTIIGDVPEVYVNINGNNISGILD